MSADHRLPTADGWARGRAVTQKPSMHTFQLQLMMRFSMSGLILDPESPTVLRDVHRPIAAYMPPHVFFQRDRHSHRN